MPVPLFVFIGFIVLYLLSCIKILKEYERGVIFRLGRLLAKPKGPGINIHPEVGQGGCAETLGEAGADNGGLCLTILDSSPEMMVEDLQLDLAWSSLRQASASKLGWTIQASTTT